jgi:hypothetical protein
LGKYHGYKKTLGVVPIMTLEELVKAVRAQAEGRPEPLERASIDAALDQLVTGEWKGRKDFYRTDVADLIQYAGRHSTHRRRVKEEIYQIDPGPREKMVAGQLHGLLEPEIAKIRRRLFSAAHPPFEAEDRAVGWIQDQRKREQRTPRPLSFWDLPEAGGTDPGVWERMARLARDVDEIFDLLECDRRRLALWLLCRLTGTPGEPDGLSSAKPNSEALVMIEKAPCEPAYSTRDWDELLDSLAEAVGGEIDRIVEHSGLKRGPLSLWVIDQTISPRGFSTTLALPDSTEGFGGERRDRNLPVLEGGKLELLATEVDEIAERTGFDRHQVCLWILTGAKPRFFRFRLTMHTAFPTPLGPARPQSRRKVEWVDLEIHASDLRFVELKDIYRRIRAIPTSSRRRVNPAHYRIYEMVEEVGGVPKTDRTAFWRGIVRRLRDEGLLTIETWRGARNAYRRLIDKHALKQ